MKFSTKVINESGYNEALLGVSLSRNAPIENMPKITEKLANKDGGHNKFLESIVVWLDITAARYWWQQFSTYRVGTSAQSESTMYSLLKQRITISNDNVSSSHFEDGTSTYAIAIVRSLIDMKEFDEAKKCLPESFLQRRIVCTNYKTLRNILLQRSKHRLPEWQGFCVAILQGVEHPELLPDIEDDLPVVL